MSSAYSLCTPILSRKIRKTVKGLRFYLRNAGDKYEATLKMLEFLEGKVWLLEGKVKPGMEVAYAEWLWELSRLSARVGDLLDVIKDVAAGVPATSTALSHWLSSRKNLFSLIYEVGSLTNICAKGELLIEVPSSRETQLKISDKEICSDNVETNKGTSLCTPILSRKISNIVKGLRFYLDNSSDKYEATLKMLEFLEGKVWLLEGKVKPGMEVAYVEWLWEVSRLSARVGDLLEVMKDVAARSTAVSASSGTISHWLSSKKNLFSVMYEVGILATTCAKGEYLIEVPPSSREAHLQVSDREICSYNV
ncbi:hypothetical protein ACP70R_004427 [Stipagrostis hirtigluma subsp. patula]